MKTCTKCGCGNDFNVLYCSNCGNDSFVAAPTNYYNNGYNNNNNNNNNNNKNTIIGVLAGIAIMAVIALFLFVITDKKDDSSKNKVNRYDYSYDEDYENEEDDEEDYEDEEETETTEKKRETTEYVEETTAGVIAPEPGNSIEGEIPINDDLRYSLNLFMSNFSEASLDSFSGRPSDDQLYKFAINYNLLNHSDRWEIGDWEVNGQHHNKRIKESHIYNSMDDHFNCSISNDIAKDKPTYSNGYFHATTTGGLMEGNISIVNYLERVSDGVYFVRFNMYFTGGGNRNCYTYNDAQMASQGDYAGSGSAYIYASDINNYYTYYLDSYSV